jgi:hypothetical protein
MDRIPIDLDVLRRAWHVALVGIDPMSDDARADHVPDKFVVAAVPDKQRGTRAAAAIEFEIRDFAITRDFDFILQHAGRPEHAHDLGLL